MFPPPTNAVKESFALPDVVVDVVVVTVSVFRKVVLPKSVMVVDMVSVQDPVSRGWLAVVFFPERPCGHAGFGRGRRADAGFEREGAR